LLCIKNQKKIKGVREFSPTGGLPYEKILGIFIHLGIRNMLTKYVTVLRLSDGLISILQNRICYDVTQLVSFNCKKAVKLNLG